MITKSCAASRYSKFNNSCLLKINTLPSHPEVPLRGSGLIYCQLKSKEGFMPTLTSDGTVLGREFFLQESNCLLLVAAPGRRETF